MDIRKTIIFSGIAADVIETLKTRRVKNLSVIISRVLSEAAMRDDFKEVLAQEVRAAELPELLREIEALYPKIEAKGVQADSVERSAPEVGSKKATTSKKSKVFDSH